MKTIARVDLNMLHRQTSCCTELTRDKMMLALELVKQTERCLAISEKCERIIDTRYKFSTDIIEFVALLVKRTKTTTLMDAY